MGAAPRPRGLDSTTKETLDFRGYFHMDELVRKTARELEGMGFRVQALTPTVLKTMIGTKVGTWTASAVGMKEEYLIDAGAVERLLGVWGFGSTFRGTVTVAFAGEGYEDFRRQVGIPFFTTATASVHGDTNFQLDYRTHDYAFIASLRRKRHLFSQAFRDTSERIRQEVAAAVKDLTVKMGAASFARECGYCKSMFVAEDRCPYCGAPAGGSGGSILADRPPGPGG